MWCTLNNILFLSFTIFLSACSDPGSNAVEGEVNDKKIPIIDPIDEFSHLDGRELTQLEKEEIDNRILNSEIKPSVNHPRLYGADPWDIFVANIESFDPDCRIGYTNSGRGSVINFKSMWDRVLYGRKSCADDLSSNLSQHNDAKHYYGVVDTTREEQEVRRLRVLHLIRRELSCHDPKISIACQFSITDRDVLIQKFYDAEITRLRTAPRFDPTNQYHIPMWGSELGFPADYTFNKRWHRTNSAQFMVLEAAPAFKFWTLFLDILWNNSVLKPDDKNYIETELDYEISSYLKQNEEKHWSLYNGNNWTAVINSGALHWAILNYYERPEKSKKVLEAILESNWTHRDFYQQDGGYKEGGSYAIGTSYPYILTQNQLFMGAFKQPIHSFNWLLGETLSNWLLNNMLSDSYLADFGDAHATQGMVSTMPLDLLLAKDMLPRENSDFPVVFKETNLCLVQKYFSNTYFDGALNDPWRMHPVLFQDWPEIIKGCASAEAEVNTEIFPVSGFSIIESKRATALGALTTEENKFNLHANENQLLMTSTATNIDHREMDIGGLIWSAHGSRIFADFGYGKLVRNYHEYDLFTNFNDRYESHLDHVLGSSTLILPEAFKLSYTNYPDNGARYEYRGQIYAGKASLSIEKYGDFEAIALDASHAYSGKDEGKFDRPAVEGLLKNFNRWLVSIDENTMLIIDSLAAKDTAKTTAEEYFLLPHDDNKSCEKVAGAWSWNVEADITSNNTVMLKPNCNQLKESRPGTSDSLGLAHFKMTAGSLRGGLFTFDKPDYIANIPLFGDDALATSAENQTVLSMLNITNKRTDRKLLRWQPQSGFYEDVRVFVLQTALIGELHEMVEVSFQQQEGNIQASLTGLKEDIVIGFEKATVGIKIKTILVR